MHSPEVSLLKAFLVSECSHVQTTEFYGYRVLEYMTFSVYYLCHNQYEALTNEN